MPGRRTWHWRSMGIYIFRGDVLVRRSRRMRSGPTASTDFGKNIIPSLIRRSTGLVLSLSTMRTRRPRKLARHRHAGRLFRGEHGSRQVNPEFNLYDPEWPCRTYQPQAPPHEVRIRREGHRCGQALDSVISNGCIISGSRAIGSILSPNGRVHSFCEIEQSILMPGVRVGRHARLRRTIVDRDVLIPRGAPIGFEATEDRRRHTVTEGGGSLSSRLTTSPNRTDKRRRAARRGRRRSRRPCTGPGDPCQITMRPIHGREILDSRGQPDGRSRSLGGYSLRPRSCSVGCVDRRTRALELRDGDPRRYSGKGVLRPSSTSTATSAILRGYALDQRAIDDRTDRVGWHAGQSRLGANALLAVSMAALKAAAAASNEPLYDIARPNGRPTAEHLLPVPMMNILNGGALPTAASTCRSSW